MPRFRVPLTLGATVLGVFAMTVAARAASPAEMRVDAPSQTQTVGAPFEVRVSITRAEATWAGYNDQLLYDPEVLKVNSVRPGGIADCKDPNTWAHQQPQPPEPGVIVAACVFQSTTETGVTEIIEFECIRDGASVLRFVTRVEDPLGGSGLIDEGAADIATDLVDASVTCGVGGPIETIAAPTPPVAPSSVPPATPSDGGTPGATSSAPAGGTPVAGSTGGTGAGGTVAPGTTAPAGPAATRAAATNTATAAKTASAQGAAQTSDDGWGMPAWLIAVIVIAILGVAAGGGWFMLQRRRGAGGG